MRWKDSNLVKWDTKGMGVGRILTQEWMEAMICWADVEKSEISAAMNIDTCRYTYLCVYISKL